MGTNKISNDSQIKQVEGIQGYFKGLGPNLVGVIPARYLAQNLHCFTIINQMMIEQSTFIHTETAKSYTQNSIMEKKHLSSI